MNRLHAVAAAAALGAALVMASPAAAQQPLCPNRFHVAVDGHQLSLPYCSNMSTGERNEAVDRIVFSVHGIGTNAEEYFDWMVAAAARVPGQSERTLIIGPQLMTASDVRQMPIRATDLFWQTSSGRYWGALSAGTEEHPREASITMFDVMDRWLEALTRPELFPNLRTVVIAGHSGGGQFTNRYAVANTFDTPAVRERLRIRYVVANPSTYVYLTDERFVGDAHDRFARPAAEEVEACPAFNRYGTGLEALDGYPYLQRLSVEQMRRQYAEREVVYLMGEADNDPNASALARGCNAMLQGAHRLERGIIYFNKLQHLYGPGILQRHSLVTVPGVAHNAGRMWASDQGVRVMFDAHPR
jgi:pimeloyl-ACP methyl ester carboxylesterase